MVVVSHDITESKQLEDTQLFLIMSGSHISGGDDFFQSLARYLAEILKMDFVCIDKLTGGGLSARTVAVYSDGEFEDNIEYALKDTPCGDVAGKTICTFEENVRGFFPNDLVLQEMKAESYAGVTLWGSTGEPIGLIAVIGREKMDNPRLAEKILKMVAIRAAGELERRDADEKIRSLLLEKEILLKEVHHRIKNNMNTIHSLLALQVESLTDPAAADALNDAQSRVQSMMVLYDKLYRSDNFDEVSIKEYLPGLITEITGNFSNIKKIRIESHIDDFILGVQTLVPVGIIVNELITNTMKYAFTGRDSGVIKITAEQIGSKAVLTIEDNGVGIPETVTFENSSGFGMQLVGMLTEQIGGSIRIERGEWTRLVLEFAV
jgi:two-component sensor histidine kinase